MLNFFSNAFILINRLDQLNNLLEQKNSKSLINQLKNLNFFSLYSLNNLSMQQQSFNQSLINNILFNDSIHKTNIFICNYFFNK